MTREEAIKKLQYIRHHYPSKNVENLEADNALYMAIEALNQQKKGEWITWKEAGNEIASETRFECSVCHDSAQTLCNGLDLLSPYCPNCGAKMIES